MKRIMVLISFIGLFQLANCQKNNQTKECLHQNTIWITEEANCTKEGLKTLKCLDCNIELQSYKIKKASHFFEWIIDINNTETTDGIKHQECSICHVVQNENTIIPSIRHPHDLTFVKEVKKTCTTDGNIAYYMCPICNKYFSDEKGKIEINPDSISIPKSHTIYRYSGLKPTCQQEGYQDYEKCLYCEFTTYQKLDKVDHSFVLGVCSMCQLANNSVFKLSLNEDKNGYIIDGVYNKTFATITIPDTYNGLPIVKINDQAFEKCRNIETINIPSTIKEIGINAFFNCQNLVKIFIPKNVEIIQSGAFNLCSNLVIYCETNNTPDTWSNQWNYSNLISYFNVKEDEILIIDDVQYLIQNDEAIITKYTSSKNIFNIDQITIGLNKYPVTKIGKEAFKNTAIKEITMPNTIIEIGDEAFSNCTKLQSITTSNKLEKISNNAFNGCSQLTNIFIPSTTTYIGESVFNNCDSLIIYAQTDKMPSTWSKNFNQFARPIYYSIELENIIKDNNIYYILQDNQICLTQCFNNQSSITIPSTIDILDKSYEVTKIGQYAFNCCATLKSISLPNTLKSIGTFAFSSCTNLEEITLPDSITFLGNAVFYYCQKLKSVTLSKTLTILPANTFANCRNLQEVVLNEQLQSIEYQAFQNCEALKKIIIPKSVTHIKQKAFSNCPLLTIYCEVEEQPNTWISNWNDDIKVIWGYKK